MDEVDVCNRALQMIGSRNNISSLSSDSEEARNCDLVYEQVRDQILGMAYWNFARATANLGLIKASPGVPESWIPGGFISGITNQYSSFYMPAPPWSYEYEYPTNCIQFRYIVSQSSWGDNSTPIFSTQSNTYFPNFSGRPQRFNIANDVTQGVRKNIVGITKGNPTIIRSIAHGLGGANIWITSVRGMTEMNFLQNVYQAASLSADTFSIPVDSTSFANYGPLDIIWNNIDTDATYRNGLAISMEALGAGAQQKVILTNAPQGIGVYTTRIVDMNEWDAQSLQALITALAGYLAIPLVGDKNLANMMFGLANQHILQARATDGNEGLTIQEHTPDWIAIRSGYNYDEYSNYGMLVNPYPSLFAVS